jgi:hypothetical protein
VTPLVVRGPAPVLTWSPRRLLPASDDTVMRLLDLYRHADPALARVLEEEAWHARLLNGSDYPLPGVMPIFSVDYLVSLGLVEESAAPVLREIRAHNPLLFDFVLKRNLRSRGKRFSAAVFQTRRFFEVESERHVRQ